MCVKVEKFKNKVRVEKPWLLGSTVEGMNIYIHKSKMNRELNGCRIVYLGSLCSFNSWLWCCLLSLNILNIEKKSKIYVESLNKCNQVNL